MLFKSFAVTAMTAAFGVLAATNLDRRDAPSSVLAQDTPKAQGLSTVTQTTTVHDTTFITLSAATAEVATTACDTTITAGSNDTSSVNPMTVSDLPASVFSVVNATASIIATKTVIFTSGTLTLTTLVTITGGNFTATAAPIVPSAADSAAADSSTDEAYPPTATSSASTSSPSVHKPSSSATASADATTSTSGAPSLAVLTRVSACVSSALLGVIAVMMFAMA